jgi:hypothetical protein
MKLVETNNSLPVFWPFGEEMISDFIAHWFDDTVNMLEHSDGSLFRPLVVPVVYRYHEPMKFFKRENMRLLQYLRLQKAGLLTHGSSSSSLRILIYLSFSGFLLSLRTCWLSRLRAPTFGNIMYL